MFNSDRFALKGEFLLLANRTTGFAKSAYTDEGSPEGTHMLKPLRRRKKPHPSFA
jgi:hypothetical protein